MTTDDLNRRTITMTMNYLYYQNRCRNPNQNHLVLETLVLGSECYQHEQKQKLKFAS